MVIFQQEGGDMYIGEIFSVFLVGGGEIDRDLHIRVRGSYEM